MDAALADEAEPARHVGLAPVAVGVGDVGEGRVVGEHAGLAGGEAQRKLHLLDRGGVAAVDAERLEQVGEAELEPGDAGIGLADLGGSGTPAASRCL